MASAPVVQSLGDLIGQYTAAYAPEQQQLDANESANEASGSAQVAGLNSAKDTAFGQIAQNASNRGMYFSGFTPNQEATYTGSTYLPALAKLQSTIASTRNTILGQKATLTSSGNTAAIADQKDEQDQLDTYNNEIQSEQAASALESQKESFEAQQNAASRAAETAAAGAAAPTAAEQLQADSASISQALQKVAGKDGYVSPQSFASARQEWTSAGYSAADFNSRFKNFANLTYGPTSKTNYGY